MIKKRRIERLARREEKNLVKRIFYLSTFSVLLAIFIFTLGIPILSKFADLTGGLLGGGGDEKPKETTLTAPIIDPLPEATNSAKLAVSGFASDADAVKIYLSDSPVGDAKVEAGKFEYKDLGLKNGENKISAKASFSGKDSDFSNIETVIFDRDEPKLEIETPVEGQTISVNNRVRVIGQTDKDAQVYANGFLGSTDADGKFEVSVPLVEGENTIEVKAIDEAGNSVSKSVKVNFRKG